MDSHPPPPNISSLPIPTAASTAAASASSAINAQAKPPSFAKMEALVREMQDPQSGIPIRSQKLFLTSIPSAFMGYDLIEWLIERLDIEDTAEAIHLANLLCQYGYFFPVGESRSLVVKDDSSLYRFQTPYYWPSQNHNADTTDYAIYLTKRLSRNKQKHGLEDYELETYGKLKRGLQHKWDFVTMQAEEQVKLAKDRKKGDKIVTDSQERAYWRVYRPPPGFTNCLEVAPVPDKTNMANRVRKKTVEALKIELEILRSTLDRGRTKVPQAEALINHTDVFCEYDGFITAPTPSNPWVSEDESFWLLNENFVEIPTEMRVRRWGISFMEVISDPLGTAEFTTYLRKEYSHENIRFWQAVRDLRCGSSSLMEAAVDSIYDEFLKPGAPCEINIDGKTMEETQNQMKNPTRYTYDLASEHVYVLLLKKDCYPRFLRSDDYKNLIANAVQPSAKKQRFFPSLPGRKKVSTSATASNSLALVQATPQPLKRLGSDEHQQQQQLMVVGGAGALASRSAGLLGGDGACGAGIILGGGTPPLSSSHRVDCDQPYSASSGSHDQGQSGIYPWDAPPTSNICPWETLDPPPTTRPAPQQPVTLHQQQSFRHHTTASTSKAKPSERSISVDICSLKAGSATSPVPTSSIQPPSSTAPPTPHIVSSASDSKVTLNICPWEQQVIPQTQKQHETSKSVEGDLFPWEPTEVLKKGSNSSIPSIVGSQDLSGDKSPSGSLLSYTDIRPSVPGERKVSLSICPFKEEVQADISPTASLQELPVGGSHLHLSSDSQGRSHGHRLSSDKTHIKIITTSSNTSEKTHRELSESVSVPCVPFVSLETPLDYTVRSGHLPGQYGLPLAGSTTTEPILSSSKSGTITHASSHTRISTAAVLSSTFVPHTIATIISDTHTLKKTEGSRIVSVSSQTQTDPIVHHKTNQQTQHPIRDTGKHSSRHSFKQAKHTSTQWTADHPTPDKVSTPQLQQRQCKPQQQSQEIQKTQQQTQTQQQQVRQLVQTKSQTQLVPYSFHQQPIQIMLQSKQHGQSQEQPENQEQKQVQQQQKQLQQQQQQVQQLQQQHLQQQQRRQQQIQQQQKNEAHQLQQKHLQQQQQEQQENQSQQHQQQKEYKQQLLEQQLQQQQKQKQRQQQLEQQQLVRKKYFQEKQQDQQPRPTQAKQKQVQKSHEQEQQREQKYEEQEKKDKFKEQQQQDKEQKHQEQTSGSQSEKSEEEFIVLEEKVSATKPPQQSLAELQHQQYQQQRQQHQQQHDHKTQKQHHDKKQQQQFDQQKYEQQHHAPPCLPPSKSQQISEAAIGKPEGATTTTTTTATSAATGTASAVAAAAGDAAAPEKPPDDSGGGQQPPEARKKDWVEDKSTQNISDICPWEDDSLTPTWL